MIGPGFRRETSRSLTPSMPPVDLSLLRTVVGAALLGAVVWSGIIAIALWVIRP